MDTLGPLLQDALPSLVSLASTNPYEAVSSAFEAGTFKGAQLDILRNLLREGDVGFLQRIGLRVWKQACISDSEGEEEEELASGQGGKEGGKVVGGGSGGVGGGAAKLAGVMTMTAIEGDVQCVDNRVRALSHFPSIK